MGVTAYFTPTLDIMGAYYGYRQNSFLTSGAPGGSLVNPTLAGASGALANGGLYCSDARSSACSGQLDMFSIAMDWRFARHFDFYAGIAYTQKANGLASGSALTATNPAVAATYNTFNKISVFDPGVGLRYQF